MAESRNCKIAGNVKEILPVKIAEVAKWQVKMKCELPARIEKV